MHRHAPPCTAMHRHAPPCTAMHPHAPLYVYLWCHFDPRFCSPAIYFCSHTFFLSQRLLNQLKCLEESKRESERERVREGTGIERERKRETNQIFLKHRQCTVTLSTTYPVVTSHVHAHTCHCEVKGVWSVLFQDCSHCRFCDTSRTMASCRFMQVMLSKGEQKTIIPEQENTPSGSVGSTSNYNHHLTLQTTSWRVGLWTPICVPNGILFLIWCTTFDQAPFKISTLYTVPVKSVDSPTHSMVFHYFRIIE